VAWQFQVAKQGRYVPVNFVSDGPDLVNGEPGWVGEVPIEVALAREDRTCFTAAHTDYDVSDLDLVSGQPLGDLAGDVDTNLCHGLHNGRVQLVRRLRAG